MGILAREGNVAAARIATEAMGVAGPGARACSEHLLKKVAEAGAGVLVFVVSSASGARAVLPVWAKGVVFLSFFGIAEDFVGFVEFFEFVLGG